jgi:hypothetical protein
LAGQQLCLNDVKNDAYVVGTINDRQLAGHGHEAG